MEATASQHISIEQLYAGEEHAAHGRLTTVGFEPVGEEAIVVDVVSAILYYRITENGIQYRLVEITNGERP